MHTSATTQAASLQRTQRPSNDEAFSTVSQVAKQMGFKRLFESDGALGTTYFGYERAHGTEKLFIGARNSGKHVVTDVEFQKDGRRTKIPTPVLRYAGALGISNFTRVTDQSGKDGMFRDYDFGMGGSMDVGGRIRTKVASNGAEKVVWAVEFPLGCSH